MLRGRTQPPVKADEAEVSAPVLPPELGAEHVPSPLGESACKTRPASASPERRRLANRLSLRLSLLGPSAPSTPRARPQSGYFSPFPRTSVMGTYDSPALQDDLARNRGNGVRVGYESYMLIDWAHDWIKESFRLRRLRDENGLRGRLHNAYDRSLGWIIVVIVGVLVAIIAGGVVMSEALLFDLKEGYCVADWHLAKRFCCPRRASSMDSAEDTCAAWVTWGDRFGSTPYTRWLAVHGVYLGVALLWSVTAAVLTVCLTSSELFDPPSPQYSAGSTPMAYDTTLRTYGTFSSGYGSMMGHVARTARAEKATAPRKTLYWGAGSGIGEVRVILSGVVIHGYLGFWALLTKALGLALSVASGLNAGKEGPFVHMASCVGNLVSRSIPGKYQSNEAKRREIISCAAAAGVAVAFGAPVGGVLFSLEEVSLYFPSKVMFRAFACALTAALTLRAIDPFGTGRIVLFEVEYDTDWRWAEVPFFLLLGVFGGVYGAAFTKLNTYWSRTVRGKLFARQPILEVAIVTSLTALLAWRNPYLRMGGAELISDLFQKCNAHDSLDGLCVASVWEVRPLLLSLLGALVAKGALAIMTFGLKLPAGIFIPSLAAGAICGRMMGLAIQYMQWHHADSAVGWCLSDTPCVVPGVYAMVGAAATLSGVTRTTISLVVIMFELTGRLTYSLPVMLAILLARTIADALEPANIYEKGIQASGLPYLNPDLPHLWADASVLDALDTNVNPIWLDRPNTLASLEQKLSHLAAGLGHPDGGFPLLVPDPTSTHAPAARLVGYISAPELEHALVSLRAYAPTTLCTFNGLGDVSQTPFEGDPLDLTRYVDSAPISIRIHTPLELVHQYFHRMGMRYLVVLEHGRFRGMIWKKSWINFVHELDERNALMARNTRNERNGRNVDDEDP